jgi:hypothetical protein
MADLPNNSCNIGNNFYDHSIIFDITYHFLYVRANRRFCGDWAGADYPNSGCPGTCASYVQNNPDGFWNSFFGVQDLKVYQATTSE